MISHLRQHSGLTGILGSITGWASVDLLRASQVVAAMLAGFVSLLTAVIIAPKAWAQLRAWWADRPWR